MDADSILPQDIPNLRTAAALEQIGDSTSEALSPMEVGSPPVRAPAHDEYADPDPTLLTPPPQHPAAVEPAPAVGTPHQPGTTPLQAHLAAREATDQVQPTAA